ncbi:MAG: hypothetical protein IKW83_00050 [Muribaculaceae bacterium]|nr:hypothetical protein [Muribaculaceae bacterium]
MNTVSQTFNWNRFIATLRKEVVENRRILLFTVIGIYALLTVIMIMGNVINHTPMDVDRQIFTKTPQSLVFMTFSFFVIAVASMAFYGLRTKAGRTNMFMSPSSNLEKFIVNVLIYIVAMIVVFFAGAQLADLTRVAVLKPFEDNGFVVPGPINFLKLISFGNEELPSNIQELQFWTGISTLLATIASIAVYFLGSVFWPRFSLLKTFLTIFIIQIVTVVLVVVLVEVDATGDIKMWLKDNVNNGNVFRAMSLFMAIVTVLACSLSWYLFKRKDVVSLKWWK